jgi:hypothetical protein
MLTQAVECIGASGAPWASRSTPKVACCKASRSTPTLQARVTSATKPLFNGQAWRGRLRRERADLVK